jgi:hypothetical protein
MRFGLNFLFCITRYLIAGLLIYSGLVHEQNSFLFLNTVLEYKVIGRPWASWVAIGIPFVHVFLGLDLVLFPNTSPQKALILFCLFLTYFGLILSQWIQESEISCGCFGGFSETINAYTVFRAAGLVFAGAVLFWHAWIAYELQRKRELSGASFKTPFSI